jgi:uncharacterized HAD superfamily protein
MKKYIFNLISIMISSIKPIRIGIDIDDVICNYHRAFIDYVNKILGYSKTTEMGTYDYKTFLNLSDLETQNLFKSFENDENRRYIIGLDPIEGAFDSLKRFKEDVKCELFIITSRRLSLYDITKEWIDKYFPDIFNKIFMCSEFDDDTKNIKYKYEICKENDIDILIDDRITHLYLCKTNNPNFYGILFRRPWSERGFYETIKDINPTIKFLSDWSNFNIDYFKENILYSIYSSKNNYKCCIGISGKFGSGKDTAALLIRDIFNNFKFESRAFAKKVKQVVGIITDTTLELNSTQEGKAFKPYNYDNIERNVFEFIDKQNLLLDNKENLISKYRDIAIFISKNFDLNRHDSTHINFYFYDVKEKVNEIVYFITNTSKIVIPGKYDIVNSGDKYPLYNFSQSIFTFLINKFNIKNWKLRLISSINERFPGIDLKCLSTSIHEILREDEYSIIPLGYSYTLGELQQIIGESFREFVDQNIWVNGLFSNPYESILIITDERYKNEANRTKDRENGYMLRIEGDPLKLHEINSSKRDLNHSSETDLDDYEKFDIFIHNYDTIDTFKNMIYKSLIPLFYHDLIKFS